MICPNCNREIDDSSRFCMFCGVEFIGEDDVLVVEDENGNTAKGERNSAAPLKVYPVGDSVTNDRRIPAERIASTSGRADPPRPKDDAERRRNIRIIEIAVAVFVIAAAVILVVTLAGKHRGTEGEDYVTDAAGEEIDVGLGRVDMTVTDLDGKTRTITSDASLLTDSAILTKYTEVMNGLKKDAPGFTKLRYQNLPTESGGFLQSIVLPYIERFVTSKDAATAENIIAGNAGKLPLYNSAYGCLLADASAVKSCYCEVISDNEYRLVMVLKDEVNAESLPVGAKSTDGVINGVFDPYDAAKFITSTAEIALSSIDFNYHDCSVVLDYDPGTEKVKSLDMTMNISIDADLLVGSVQAEITDVTEFYNFSYS